MNTLEINFEAGRRNYRPGEKIRGIAKWRLEEAPFQLTIHLLWHTEGRGTEDVSVIDKQSLNAGSRFGDARFEFEAPGYPYSFSGKLISLIWGVELVSNNPDENVLQRIEIGPNATEINLATLAKLSESIR